MSAVLDELVPQADAPDPPAGPRRRWWRLLVPVLAIVLAGAVALGVWAWNFQPLTGTSLAAGVVSNSIDVVEIDNTFGVEYRLVKPAVGATGTAIFTLYNTSGRFPITVESIDLGQWLTGSRSHVGYFDQIEVMVRPDERRLATEPFTPTALGPSEFLEFQLELTIADCAHRGAGTSGFHVIPVTYSAFGLAHTEEIRLPYALTLERAPQCSGRR